MRDGTGYRAFERAEKDIKAFLTNFQSYLKSAEYIEAPLPPEKEDA
jgi:hypothetical protein